MQTVATGVMTFRATMMHNGGPVVLEDSSLSPAVTQGGTDLARYLQTQEADPDMAAALKRMRARVALKREQQSGVSLAVLRQRKGLSQVQLASAMETSQPNIARWEKDPDQMTAKSIRRMACELGVKEQDIHDAMAPVQSKAVAHEIC